MRLLGWLTAGLGNLPVDMDTKASSGTDKLGRRRRRRKRGSKRATFKFQLFQVSTRGRKEGRGPETSGSSAAALAADGMRERRIRFGAEKIHIKAVTTSECLLPNMEPYRLLGPHYQLCNGLITTSTNGGTRSVMEVLFISFQKFLLQFFSCLAAQQL